MSVLGIESESSAKAAISFNHWVTSPVPPWKKITFIKNMLPNAKKYYIKFCDDLEKKNLIFPFKQTSEIYTWRNTEKVLSYLNGPMVSVGSRLDWCLSEQLALISTFIVKVPWDVRTGWAERIIPLSPLWLIPPPQKTRLKCFVKACKAISLPPAGCQHWQRSALRNTCSQEPSF